MKTLVDDDPEEQPEIPTIDNVVVEKTETFWSFLKSLLSAIWNFLTRVRKSKALGNAGRKVWYGDKRKH